ncbi:UBP-type zinc finger domain-containing protein [Frondihabitans peucedani]|uniref:UBP-type zinc finger domain-containing protein n=1 Tax=Frondihabitans peucedani TaxID=598626 RepID=UPI0031DBB159
MTDDDVDELQPPSGGVCFECEAAQGWWLHLRRCAKCGHVGCCDSSPSQHASAHARDNHHPLAQSFEPGEEWFWNYDTEAMAPWRQLAPPTSRPEGSTSPGPRDRVPANWRELLH